MSNKQNNQVIPKLRFPEFQNDPEWDQPNLEQISDRIVEKVGDKILTTVSISAGFGFVSQAEKFSRDISGQQYKNYILLKEGEFAYNKGNSKRFPQGCIYKLKEFKEAAAPNAFICFRFKDNVVADFYIGYFEKNIHGKQLQKFISSGARMDGLLNISPIDFFSIVLPTPTNQREQQKIADCLSSLNQLITAESQQLGLLKAHKNGLMQQLFPTEGETEPKRRFKEFKDDGEWEEKALGEVAEIITGSTPSTIDLENYGGERLFVSPADISQGRYISQTKTVLTEKGYAQTRHVKANSVLFVCIGSSIGKIAQNKFECATNQQTNSLVPRNGYESDFLYSMLEYKAPLIAELAGKQAVPIINKSLFSSITLLFPAQNEQQKIASCLFSLDKLISAQAEKIEELKAHKKGLMQGLFPNLKIVTE